MKEKWTTQNAPVPSPWIAQVSRDDTLGIAYISGLISQKGDDVIFGLSAAEERKIILDNLKTIVTDMGLTIAYSLMASLIVAALQLRFTANQLRLLVNKLHCKIVRDSLSVALKSKNIFSCMLEADTLPPPPFFVNSAIV